MEGFFFLIYHHAIATKKAEDRDTRLKLQIALTRQEAKMLFTNAGETDFRGSETAEDGSPDGGTRAILMAVQVHIIAYLLFIRNTEYTHLDRIHVSFTTPPTPYPRAQQIQLFEFSEKAAAQEFILGHINSFKDEGSNGVILFLYSLLFSRTLESRPPPHRLSVPRAPRSREIPGLRTPRLPAWLCGLSGRHGVLLGTGGRLLSDWRRERVFHLYFYSRQAKTAHLTIGMHPSSRGTTPGMGVTYRLCIDACMCVARWVLHVEFHVLCLMYIRRLFITLTCPRTRGARSKQWCETTQREPWLRKGRGHFGRGNALKLVARCWRSCRSLFSGGASSSVPAKRRGADTPKPTAGCGARRVLSTARGRGRAALRGRGLSGAPAGGGAREPPASPPRARSPRSLPGTGATRGCAASPPAPSCSQRAVTGEVTVFQGTRCDCRFSVKYSTRTPCLKPYFTGPARCGGQPPPARGGRVGAAPRSLLGQVGSTPAAIQPLLPFAVSKTFLRGGWGFFRFFFFFFFYCVSFSDTHLHPWEEEEEGERGGDPGQRRPPVEVAIRTKWAGATVSWNRTDPF
ncbi:inactive ubiquitin carboxyl-terminal hydrolase MINDY-4B [Tyto alba]|uniref:inactive ubiquitin carboxyl-terminal hydrolase MINDY-4B n=1 Tax=Tyto alba TaxID=56313 RepID=UPI001C66AA36|nr:inactive ubiquitin carboxyl-terminal hydrolase MINDY-4B [Tyto alba]